MGNYSKNPYYLKIGESFAEFQFLLSFYRICSKLSIARLMSVINSSFKHSL